MFVYIGIYLHVLTKNEIIVVNAVCTIFNFIHFPHCCVCVERSLMCNEYVHVMKNTKKMYVLYKEIYNISKEILIA